MNSSFCWNALSGSGVWGNWLCGDVGSVVKNAFEVIGFNLRGGRIRDVGEEKLMWE